MEMDLDSFFGYLDGLWDTGILPQNFSKSG